MELLAVVDGAVVPLEQARIPVTDPGLLRGDGVFEVCRLYGGRPFALDAHLERMARSARNLRLDAFDAALIRADAERLLDVAGPVDGALRLVWTRGGVRLALLEHLPDLPPTLRLATVEFAPTRLLDAVKSLSYAANMLSTRLAQERGADQALLVTPHGRVLEGPTSSFFCVLPGDGLVTPPLSDHILDSITRRVVMSLSEAREQVLTLEDLGRAEEAFLASTTREVHPVRAIDGRELPKAPGPFTQALAARVSEHIAAAVRAG
jgi:branched-chain amino acid aminotransferase